MFQPADEAAEEVHFTRTIAASADGASHSSQYQIDGRSVAYEAYNAQLESINILVKARNFLIFQACVGSRARRQLLHACPHVLATWPGFAGCLTECRVDWHHALPRRQALRAAPRPASQLTWGMLGTLLHRGYFNLPASFLFRRVTLRTWPRCSPWS